jgi:hypothetical protein
MVKSQGPNMVTVEEKGKFLKDLFTLHENILKDLETADVGEYGKKYLLEDAKSDFVKVLGGAKNVDEFIRANLKNQDTYNSLLSGFLGPLNWVFSYQKNMERKDYAKVMGIAELARNPVFKYQILINRYEDTLDAFKTRIKFLDNIQKNVVFSPDDEGTRIKVNIIDNFRSIESKLYGRVGYSFLSFIVRRLVKDDLELDGEFKDFGKLKETAAKKKEIEKKEKLKMKACANAKHIQLLWNTNQSYIELAYDFIEANKDSFHKPLTRLKLFAGFFPIRRSDQKFIFDQANSAFDAKELIEKNILKKKGLKKNSLGRWMVELILDKEKMLDAQQFIDENNCAQH